MVELVAQRESPFQVTGETVKKVKKGETVTFNLTINGDPTAPSQNAKIVFSVAGPADPMTDYKDPVWTLNGEQIDARRHIFPYPSGAIMTLDVDVTITERAKWFKELRIRADVVPSE